MRGLVATTAVLGVVAIGGLPALALTLAADETGPAAERTTTLVEERGSPPPWAQGGGTPHGWAVRAWAHCVRDHLRDAAGERVPGTAPEPRSACGEKPLSPGQAKKVTGTTKKSGDKPGKPDGPAGQSKPSKPGKHAGQTPGS